ncbi:MAG: hypothetical protein R8L58_01830, partial [Mariprofundaceae bacterium]
NAPRFIRGFIVDRIRGSIPKKRHGTFMLATKKIDAWKKLADFKRSDAAYLVLLNRNHEIVWKHAGALSRRSLQIVRNRVASVMPLEPENKKLQAQESFSNP